MPHIGQDTLKTRDTLVVGGKQYQYFSIKRAADHFPDLHQLPYSLKILLENTLRYENGQTVTTDDVAAFGDWVRNQTVLREIAFQPARVLMQDFTGVPAIVDLAAMRSAVLKRGGDPRCVNPLYPVDLVIDHSVMVDHYGDQTAFRVNVAHEYDRNQERYTFLRWGQQAFDNFRVVPPGTGICHQVNLEYLSKVVWQGEIDGALYAYPDTLVGTDSHTTMVNGLGVLGWGVGGIEAEAAMLGQPISMLIPDVIGFELTGQLPAGTTATDLVLTITQILRTEGVVGKFVEFYGSGLSHLSLADRATISNMAPEYGATCGIFPVDDETLRYLALTGRSHHEIDLVKAYTQAQGLFHGDHQDGAVYTKTLHLDLQGVEPSLAGPGRPQDRIALHGVPASVSAAVQATGANGGRRGVTVQGQNGTYTLHDGDVVIAAITSCTNTSNPSVMLGAGLLAKKAVERGLSVKPWVKTSLAPGSKVVTDYLDKAGLLAPLGALGFDLVGYGCTTCIGNSGPLRPEIAGAIDSGDLCVASVLSGNRNFEGRIHPQVRLSYLASPLLVVAYALAGSMAINLTKDAIGYDKNGHPVYLKDIWPNDQEIRTAITSCVDPNMFKARYLSVFEGDRLWRELDGVDGLTYTFDHSSTYVKEPPYFQGYGAATKAPLGEPILGARALAILGDSITTDHISPAGSIKADGPAGLYLTERGVDAHQFNSYGSRRGNHEIMMRGTFANIRLKNEMVPGSSGGITRHMPDGTPMSIYDASMAYQQEGVPLLIMAGKEYGTGSSRDWAAKGTKLLGVQGVIAESFERIHRSNLVGMGVLPLQFADGHTRQTLRLDGSETFDVTGMEKDITPRMTLSLRVHYLDGSEQVVPLTLCIDTADEIAYMRSGGILPYVLDSLMEKAS